MSGKYAGLSHGMFSPLIRPANRSAMEKRNSKDAFPLLELKWIIEYTAAVAVPAENHRTGVVAGKSLRRPAHVRMRKSKGMLFFIRKPCPFLSPLP